MAVQTEDNDKKKEKINLKVQRLINNGWQDVINTVNRYFTEIREVQLELQELADLEKKDEKKEIKKDGKTVA